jgi:hypothetical protein
VKGGRVVGEEMGEEGGEEVLSGAVVVAVVFIVEVGGRGRLGGDGRCRLAAGERTDA